MGIVLSAEYVFATRPGDPIPDDRRYGILWMGRRALASAFDMEGGFNDVVASMAPGANLPAVLAAVDTLLEPYGGLVAYGRTDQPSHRFLADEIAQQGVMATTIPVVFLCVSVFLLHGMLGRLVGAQREQIAALKALGYGNRSIAWHYVKFALAVVGTGALLGILLGLWFGWMMVANYTNFFRFPRLAFHLDTLGADPGHRRRLLAGVIGAINAVGSVARLAPAEAMRPRRRATTGMVHSTGLAGSDACPRVNAWCCGGCSIDHCARVLTIAGIALAVPIIVVTLFWQDALDFMIDVQFAAVGRGQTWSSVSRLRSPRARSARLLICREC